MNAVMVFTGRQGRYTESSGLQIAYLSGMEGSGEGGDISTFSSQDVVNMLLPVLGDSRFRGVDILLTSQWPRGVEKYGSEPVRMDC